MASARAKRPLLMRSQLLPLLLAHMASRGRGEAAAALVAEFDLPEPTGDPIREMLVPLDVHRLVCDRAAMLLSDPFLGLHVAAESPRGKYGLVEFTTRSAPTLGAGLRRTVKYLRLLSDVIEIRVDEDEHGATIVHRIPGQKDASGRHANEFALATVLRFGRENSGVRIVATAVDFAHPEPEDVSELHAYFGTTQMRFDRGENRLHLAPDVLALPVLTKDEALLAWLDQHAEKSLPPAGPLPGLRRCIQEGLGRPPGPTLESVAAAFHMTPRTLQRRLGEASTSFQAELDAVRDELATTYLENPKLSIYEVALLLGFADQGAFERAFRRWRGVTPKQFRKL